LSLLQLVIVHYVDWFDHAWNGDALVDNGLLSILGQSFLPFPVKGQRGIVISAKLLESDQNVEQHRLEGSYGTACRALRMQTSTRRSTKD
jgi:hypothetical protein